MYIYNILRDRNFHSVYDKELLQLNLIFICIHVCVCKCVCVFVTENFRFLRRNSL